MFDYDEVPKHRRSKKGVKKLFSIEHRWNPEHFKNSSVLQMWRKHNEWTVWRRYETEKARDEAFKNLDGKYDHYEYRIPDGPVA